MALKDILTSAKYADDMILSLPDGTTATVGEMRGMEASERNALIRRQQTLEAAEQGLLQRTTKLREAGLLDDNLEPVTTRDIKQAVRASGISEDDPLFGDIVKETKAQIAQIKAEAQKEIDGVKQQMTQLAGATRQAVSGYLDDYYKATFANSLTSLPESLRNEVKLEDAVKFATDRKLTDAVGRLDISNAIDRITWDRRKEIERQELAKSAQTLKEERQQFSQMTRPGLSGRKVGKSVEGFNPVDDKGHAKSIDQAIAEASSDDALWESAAKFVN